MFALTLYSLHINYKSPFVSKIYFILKQWYVLFDTKIFLLEIDPTNILKNGKNIKLLIAALSLMANI